MKRIVFILALVLFSFQGYAQSTPSNFQVKGVDQTQYAQVLINTKGKLFVNGEKMNIKKFDKAMANLKERKGYMRLAREGKYNKKVASTLKKVSEVMRKYGRISRTYSDKTFTKTVDL